MKISKNNKILGFEIEVTADPIDRSTAIAQLFTFFCFEFRKRSEVRFFASSF